MSNQTTLTRRLNPRAVALAARTKRFRLRFLSGKEDDATLTRNETRQIRFLRE